MKNRIISILRSAVPAFFMPIAGAFGQCTVAFQNCPTSITVMDCDNSGDEKVDWAMIVANPAGFCKDFALAQTGGPPSGTLLTIGQYSVAFYAAANDLNSPTMPNSTCVFSVNVVKDIQPPAFAFCPPNLTVQGIDNGFGNCEVQTFWPNPIVSDNCGNEPNLTASHPCGATFQNGTSTIIYTATDPSGNTTSCSFTVTVNCVTESSEVSQTKPIFTIRPNPNPGQFTIELSGAAKPETLFRICDISGRQVMEKTADAGSNRQTIHAEMLPPGMYFLQVISGGRLVAVEKFVKQ